MHLLRWLIAAAMVAVFGGFGLVVWLALNESRQTQGEPPLIGASGEPFRHAPEERGGIALLNEGSAIVGALDRSDLDPKVVERILPAPPPAPLSAAEALGMAPRPTTDGSAPVPSPLLASPPAPSVPLVAPETLADSAPTDPPEDIADADIDGDAGPIDEIGAELPEALQSPETDNAGGIASVAVDPPAETGSTPRLIPPEALPVVVAPSASPGPPQVVAAVEPTVPTPPVKALERGSFRVQLAAFRDAEQARQAWAVFERRHPGLLAGLKPFLQQAETSGGTFHRLQTDPPLSREAADGLCQSIKQAGGDCLVTGAGS